MLDLLGKGGFATVFRAKSKINNQEVAIKKVIKLVCTALVIPQLYNTIFIAF